MKCPECHKFYRCPEGEEGEHDCPYCGSSPFDYPESDPHRDHDEENLMKEEKYNE